MKIKTLIKKLNKLDPNLEVVLSSDAEGNSYGILEEIVYLDDEYLFDEKTKEYSENGKIKSVTLYPR